MANKKIAKQEVAEKTALQTAGIATLSAGVAQVQIGGDALTGGVVLAVVGVVLLAIKYWRV